ncbi:hypothetical protein Hanom_Chr15g01351941 [Helianthus anomalus]
MMDKGITRSCDSVLDTGHEFQDQRRPSIASSSTKSMLGWWNLGGSCEIHGLDWIRCCCCWIQGFDFEVFAIGTRKVTDELKILEEERCARDVT